MKKALKGNCFADVKEVKQKIAEALKGIKISKFKTDLNIAKNISIHVLHETESTLKETEVYTCKDRNTTFCK